MSFTESQGLGLDDTMAPLGGTRVYDSIKPRWIYREMRGGRERERQRRDETGREG
jgi:hypothetical protein